MGLLPHLKFQANLEIVKITRVPQNAGNMSVRWHVTDSARPETRGRTDFVEIDNHQCTFNYSTDFHYRLGVSSGTRVLRSSTLEFEVVWEPMGGHKIVMGTTSVNISQFVDRKPELLSFLLEDSRANSLLTVSLSLEHIKGTTNYKVPEFDQTNIQTDLAGRLEADESVGPRRLFSTNILNRIRAKYIVDWEPSRYHVNPLEALNEVIHGGSGFADLEPPPWPNQPHEEGQPYCETDLRENFVSWVWPMKIDIEKAKKAHNKAMAKEEAEAPADTPTETRENSPQPQATQQPEKPEGGTYSQASTETNEGGPAVMGPDAKKVQKSAVQAERTPGVLTTEDTKSIMKDAKAVSSEISTEDVGGKPLNPLFTENMPGHSSHRLFTGIPPTEPPCEN